ncbi:MAG: FprA family A-type flavoprotein [Clostridia bacterium]
MGKEVVFKMIKVAKNIYEVGAVDWNLRNFHGYSTARGSSYNAYLIVDEKVALIDTVKRPFAETMLSNIREIIDPGKIDYIISNHVEPDHSGSLPVIANAAVNARVLTSDPSGLAGLKAYYGADFEFSPVKSGDSLKLGVHTLSFVQTPMVHWPDNMVTYCPEEKLLFSNDAFGQHLASSKKFDDENDFPIIMEEAAKYYANIVLPYSKQVEGIMKIVRSLDIDIIAPSHGIIFRSAAGAILDKYDYFASSESENKAVVVYDSMWGSTESMARAIMKGLIKSGLTVSLYDLKYNHISDIITDVMKAKYVAVGSPTLNNNMMPSVAAFLTYMKGLVKIKKKAFAFGSFGWGGQSIGLVNEALISCGFEIVLDPIKQKFAPLCENLDAITQKVISIID